jgi:hypothetical protein
VDETRRGVRGIEKDDMSATNASGGGKQLPLQQDSIKGTSYSVTRSPQDTLLNVASRFVHSASMRIKELYKLINDPNLKMNDVFDIKSHNRLFEIAHCILKQSDESRPLSGPGLQKYAINDNQNATF